VGHQAVIRDVAWHPTEPLILSSSWDQTVQKWSYQQKPAGGSAMEEENHITNANRILEQDRINAIQNLLMQQDAEDDDDEEDADFADLGEQDDDDQIMQTGGAQAARQINRNENDEDDDEEETFADKMDE